MTCNRPLAGSILTLFFSFCFDLQAASTNSGIAVQPAPATARAKLPVLKSAAAPLAPRLKSHIHQRRAELPVLSSDELENIRQQDRAADRKRLRIAVGRTLAEPVVINGQTVPVSSWTTLADGSHLCTVHVTSRGAMGLRVHIE